MDSLDLTPPLQEDDSEEIDPVELIIKPPPPKSDEKKVKDGDQKKIKNGMKIVSPLPLVKSSLNSEDDREKTDSSATFHPKKLKNKASLRVRRSDENDCESGEISF